VPGPIKSTFFLVLFAVEAAWASVLPRLGKEGPKQILFSVIVWRCLLVPAVCARWPDSTGLRLACRRLPDDLGLDRCGIDQVVRLGLPANRPRPTSTHPISYVTYIFGTIGSAIVLAQVDRLIGGPAAACAEYEADGRRRSTRPGVFSAYRRPRRIGSMARPACGKPVRSALPRIAHLCGASIAAIASSTRTAKTLEPGDVVSPAARGRWWNRSRTSCGGTTGAARHAGHDGGCPCAARR
jgi:hypothetical protein